MANIVPSSSNEDVFSNIRRLYRSVTKRNTLSQYWLPEISNETLEYAYYRKFIQTAKVKGKTVGFAIAFSSIIEGLDPVSAKMFDGVRSVIDASKCIYLYIVLKQLEEQEEIFEYLVTESIIQLTAVKYYFSKVIILEHNNTELHLTLGSLGFKPIAHFRIKGEKLPVNILSRSIA